MSHWTYIKTAKCPTCGNVECLFERHCGGTWGMEALDGMTLTGALIKIPEILEAIEKRGMTEQFMATSWPHLLEAIRKEVTAYPHAIVVIH